MNPLVALTFPFTSNFSPGEVVPMPTLPELFGFNNNVLPPLSFDILCIYELPFDKVPIANPYLNEVLLYGCFAKNNPTVSFEPILSLSIGSVVCDDVENLWKTSNLAPGEVVPMPTLPLANIVIFSSLLVKNSKPFVSSAVIFVLPVGVFTPPKPPHAVLYPSNSLFDEL